MADVKPVTKSPLPLASVADEAKLLINKLSSMLSCGAKKDYTSSHVLTGAG